MYMVIETPTYLHSIAGIWNDGQAAEFVNFIADNPDAGDIIPGSGGLRKIRWARPGMGKRGGARVIYFVRSARGVVLVTAYTKGRVENIPAHILRKLMEKYDV